MHQKKRLSHLDLKLLAGLLCFFYSFSFSQTTLDSVSTTDYMLANGWKGNAQYKTTKNGIKEGAFKFNSSSILKDSARFISDIRFTGNYLSDKKNGDWKFTHSLLQRGQIAQVRDFQIIYNGKGKTHSVLGQFKEDLPNKKWEVITQEVNHSGIIDTTFFAQTQFDAHQMVGTFLSYAHHVRINGTISEDGFFNGEWSFIYYPSGASSIQEKRIYNNGILKRHLFIENNQTLEIKHIGLDSSFSEENETWESLNVNQDYFDVLAFSSFHENEEKQTTIQNTIEASNDFLVNSMNSFSQYQNKKIWNLDVGNNSFNLPKIKLKKYAYSVSEKNLIEEAIHKIKISKNSIHRFLKNPQVDIIKHKHEEIALYYEVYREYLNNLNVLERLFNQLRLKSFEYINRKEIFPFIFSGINYPQTIRYEFNSKIEEKQVDFPNDVPSTSVTIPLLSKQTNEIHQHINEIESLLLPILELHQKRIEIAEKEEQLVILRDSIQQLFTNEFAQKDYNNFHKRYGKDIIAFVENSFKEYAQKDIEERIRITDEYISCFSDFVSSYKQFCVISGQINDIKELYTRVVWNPFTFTDMEEIVKERVFNTYQNYLLPAYLDDLGSEINCTQFKENILRFHSLFEKMIELRDEDTKELERELRRVSDIRKIEQLFEIKQN